jgi:hypothetical protein
VTVSIAVILTPGAALQLRLGKRSPHKRLSLDLVHDALAWWRDRGHRHFTLVGSGLPGARLPGAAWADELLPTAVEQVRRWFPEAVLAGHLPRLDAEGALASGSSPGAADAPAAPSLPAQQARRLRSAGLDILLLDQSSAGAVAAAVRPGERLPALYVLQHRAGNGSSATSRTPGGLVFTRIASASSVSLDDLPEEIVYLSPGRASALPTPGVYTIFHPPSGVGLPGAQSP